MVHIEQALLTLAEDDRATHSRVVAASCDVVAVDRMELAAWGPAVGAFVDRGSTLRSVQFHPLPSGAFCIARTENHLTAEHRREFRTHALVIRDDDFAAFGNDPFAVLDAASKCHIPTASTELGSLHLESPISRDDQAILTDLASRLTPRQIAALVQGAMDSVCLAVTGGDIPFERLLRGLLHCLPPACRSEFSFSTGLLASSERPYHLTCPPADPAQRRELESRSPLGILDLDRCQTWPATSQDGWATLVQRVFELGRLEFLVNRLSLDPDCDRCDLGNLPALGRQWLGQLDGPVRSGPVESDLGGENTAGAAEEPGPADAPPRAHAAHHRFEKTRTAGTAVQPSASVAIPSATMEAENPEVVEKLELLDDLVYEGMTGRAAAIERLKSLWPTMLKELGPQLMSESREQYLRYAISLWQHAAGSHDVHDPATAIHALDVLSILFDEMP